MLKVQNDIDRVRSDLFAAKYDLGEKEMESDEVGSEIDGLRCKIEELEGALEELELIPASERMDMFGDIAGKNIIVRDEHDKLRYTDKVFEILILGSNDIYGCNDFVPHRDSELVNVGELCWCDR